MIYNVYDKNDNLVFIGNFSEVLQWLNCNAAALKSAISQCCAVKRKYYVISRDDMRDYEVHRGNKAGYQRV